MIREDRWITLDFYRRRVFLKYELKALLLRSLSRSQQISYIFRYYTLYYKSRLVRFSTIGEQRNRCIITGRVWNVLKKTHYSRFVFRTESYHGNMPGCKKASW